MSGFGSEHPRWQGGHWNRGSIAWANKLLRSARCRARLEGIAPPNITSEKVVELYESFAGHCQLCNSPVDKGNGRKLCLDHCHCTGKVRGFICHHCNTCLGWFESRRDKILSYVGAT